MQKHGQRRRLSSSCLSSRSLLAFECAFVSLRVQADCSVLGSLPMQLGAFARRVGRGRIADAATDSSTDCIATAFLCPPPAVSLEASRGAFEQQGGSNDGHEQQQQWQPKAFLLHPADCRGDRRTPPSHTIARLQRRQFARMKRICMNNALRSLPCAVAPPLLHLRCELPSLVQLAHSPPRRHAAMRRSHSSATCAHAILCDAHSLSPFIRDRSERTLVPVRSERVSNALHRTLAAQAGSHRGLAERR